MLSSIKKNICVIVVIYVIFSLMSYYICILIKVST